MFFLYAHSMIYSGSSSSVVLFPGTNIPENAVRKFWEQSERYGSRGFHSFISNLASLSLISHTLYLTCSTQNFEKDGLFSHRGYFSLLGRDNNGTRIEFEEMINYFFYLTFLSKDSVHKKVQPFSFYNCLLQSSLQ